MKELQHCDRNRSKTVVEKAEATSEEVAEELLLSQRVMLLPR